MLTAAEYAPLPAAPFTPATQSHQKLSVVQFLGATTFLYHHPARKPLHCAVVTMYGKLCAARLLCTEIPALRCGKVQGCVCTLPIIVKDRVLSRPTV